MPTHDHRLDAQADRDFLREARIDPYTGVTFRPTNVVVVAADGTVLLRQTWDALDGRYNGSSETLPWGTLPQAGDGAAAGAVSVSPGRRSDLPPARDWAGTTRIEQAEPERRSRAWLWALLAIVGIAALAIGGLFLSGVLGTDEPPPVVEETTPEAPVAPVALQAGTTEGTLADGDVRGADGRYQDRFTFEADSSGRILGFVVEASDFSPDLFVTAPDGRRYDAEGLSDDGDRVGVRNLSGAGTYEVTVTSREPLGEGAYTLTVRQETPVQSLSANGRTVNATLGQRSEIADGFFRDTYTFRAEAEREYTLSIASSAFGVVPTLTTGGSRVRSEDRTTGNGRVLVFTPSSTATYRLVVTSDKRGGKGAYTLNLAAGPKPERPDTATASSGGGGSLVANGAPASDSLGTGETRTYTFRGRVGDQVRLDARSTGFTPRLVLIGPDGRRIVADPSPDRASLRTTLITEGTYRVQLGSGEGSGTYRIGLEQSEGQRAADIPRVPIGNAPESAPPPVEQTPPPEGEDYEPQPLGDDEPGERP